MSEIRKVCVIGSGVMGSRIASLIASANIQVYLIDIVPNNAENRDILAETAVKNLLSSKPASFTHPNKVNNLKIGNLEDNLDFIADSDLIIEAIIENLDIKKALYQKIASLKKPDAIVASNTSTFAISRLTEGFSQDFANRFIIAHFFNPPRYLKLLELVSGPKTLPEVTNLIAEFCTKSLGKTVVKCKDSPGFIGNRIGCFWLELSIRAAIEFDISPFDADKIMGKELGIPSTGVFGLADLIGIDLLKLISESLIKNLDKSDDYHKIYKPLDFIDNMIKDGYNGRKGKGGFYRIIEENGQKTKQVLNLKSFTYEKIKEPNIEILSKIKEDPKLAIKDENKYGKFLNKVLSGLFKYCQDNYMQMADDIYSIDKAMKIGYGWRYGPFEMMKIFDFSNVFTNDQYIEAIPFKTAKALIKSIIKENDSTSLADIGNNMALLSFKTKMNVMDESIFNLILELPELLSKKQGLIIASDSANFSAGANLKFVLEMIDNQDFDKLSSFIKLGQRAFNTIKHLPLPVIASVRGFALGGGFELMAQSSHIVSHMEAKAGLVETTIGLIPGWGGCKEMLIRNHQNMDKLKEAFSNILFGKIFDSADFLKEALNADDEHFEIVMNSDFVIEKAIEKLSTISNFKPHIEESIIINGNAIKPELENFVCSIESKLDDYQKLIATKLLDIFSCGGDFGNFTAEEIYELEFDHFMELARHPESRARIASKI